MQMDIRKNKKLAQIGQKIAKTKTTIYHKSKSLLKSIYLSRFFVFLRPVTDRLRKLLRPFYRWIRPKILRKKLHISYLLILGLIFGSLLIIFYLDLKKDYGYDPIKPADYSAVDWPEKIDNNGFSYSKRGNFKWKVTITPPNKAFIFKPSRDIAEVKMQIRDLRGSIQVSPGVKIIDQEGNISTSKRVTSLANQKEATLVGGAHFTSLLGLSFISPIQGKTITVNGSHFNTATIQLPDKTKIIKFGDGTKANSYVIDEQNIFFRGFGNAAVVYYHKDFHLFIQILILIVAILSFLAFLYFKKIKIKRLKLNYQDFLFAGLAIIFLMIIFALLIPNPKKLILKYDGSNTPMPQIQNTKILGIGGIPGYLRWVLLTNQSFDGAIIGNINDCSLNDLRLSQLGVKKIVILENYKNNACAKKALIHFPRKTVVASQIQLEDEIKSIKTRDYGYNNKLFPYNAKLIFILSNILLAIASALLIWMAFNIKSLRDIIFFIAVAFSSYFIIMAIYTIIGALAHMPIGYHGTADFGLIMSNYFMPGVIAGGNNIRLLFALLGLIFIVIASREAFKGLAYRAFFAVIFIFCLLMLIPNTEYHAKRFALSGLSAEAYIWDYKMDVFNSLDLYKSIREVDFINYYNKVTDPEVHGEREIEYAVSLKTQGRVLESQTALQNIIIKYADTETVKASATYELANLYLFQAKNQKFFYGLKKSYKNPQSYYKLALEYYLIFINDYPSDIHVPDAMKKTAEIFEITEDRKKAIRAYQTIIELNPDSPQIISTKIRLAQIYIEDKQYNKAINIYQEIINNSQNFDQFLILSNLANVYYLNNQIEKAEKTYLDLLELNIKNINNLSKILSNLDKFKNYQGSNSPQNLIKALDLEKITKNKEALRQYINLENSYEAQILKSISKFRINEILTAGIYQTEKSAQINQENLLRLKEIVETSPNSYIASQAEQYIGDFSDEDLEIQPDYKIFVNDLYQLDINDNEIQDNSEFEKISIIKEKINFDCGNNICEIGETGANCPKDCNSNKNQLAIKANSSGVNIKNWPKIKLMVNDKYLTTWEIGSDNASHFSIPFEYLSKKEVKIDLLPIKNNEGNVYIQSIYLNQQEIKINKYLKSIFIIEDTSLRDKTISLSQHYPIVKNIKDKTDKLLAIIIPYEFENFFNQTKISRGMALYFSGIVCLLFISLYSNSVRTFITPFIMLFIARGILRIAEQDPFRAWNSVYSGLITGLQLTMVFIAINSAVFILAIVLSKFHLAVKKRLDIKIK